MPEVRMDQYAELQEYDSNLSVIFNAWLELFVPSARRMLPSTFDVYLLLLSVLWNEKVASRRSQNSSVQVAAVRATGSHLKRQRQEACSEVRVRLCLFYVCCRPRASACLCFCCTFIHAVIVRRAQLGA